MMELKNFIVQAIFSFIGFTGFTQNIELEEMCILPAELNENSGMAVVNDSTFWFLNDSGNEPILYMVNNSCQILKRKYVLNAPNIDWEELAQDPKGNLYIGDFGNNRNRRESLHIYKINAQDLYGTSDTLKPEWGICYSYKNQVDFPPAKDQRNYDMEAMVFFEDSLYLFTKNRTKPFDAYTYMYVLPAEGGVYNISPRASAKTLEGMGEVNWVAAADFSLELELLLLLGYDKIFAFHGKTPAEALRGKKTLIHLNLWKQFECIAFGQDYVFVSNERNRLNTQVLYRFEKSKLRKMIE